MSNVLPPEFQIRETQTIEFEEPSQDAFYPNNHGSQGWSPMPPKLERQVGMDPTMKYGQDAATAAAQSGADAVANLLRQTGIEQVNTTRVTEYEGGSTVHYHEPTRDEQVSMVHGVPITGDPENVEQALMVGNRATERMPTVEAQQARETLNKQTRGMNESTRMAYLEMIRQKGGEAIESVSSGINEAIGTRVIKSTDSGVPYFNELQGRNPALIELRDIMRYHGERQRKGAARPAAKYHPSQSNYRSRHGAFGALPGLDFNVEAAADSMVNKVAPSTTTVKNTYNSGASVGPGDSAYSAPPTATRDLTDPRVTSIPRLMMFRSKLLQDQAAETPSGTDTFTKTSLMWQTALTPRTSAPAEPMTGSEGIINPDPAQCIGCPGQGLDYQGNAVAPTAGNGNEDSMAFIGEDGVAYYAPPTMDVEAGISSKTKKIAIAAVAAVGLLLLLRG